jgi:hypothetical protein
MASGVTIAPSSGDCQEGGHGKINKKWGIYKTLSERHLKIILSRDFCS